MTELSGPKLSAMDAARLIGKILHDLDYYNVVSNAAKLIGSGYGAALELPGLVVVIGDPKPEEKPKRSQKRKAPK